MDLPCTRRVDPVHQSPRTRMYGYFTHGTDPPPRPCSSGFLSLPNRLRRLPFPAHFRRRLPGHAAFTALEVLHSRPSTGSASLATSLSLIGLLTPVPTGDSASPPEVTRCSSIPFSLQTPWCARRPGPFFIFPSRGAQWHSSPDPRPPKAKPRRRAMPSAMVSPTSTRSSPKPTARIQSAPLPAFLRHPAHPEAMKTAALYQR